MRLKRAVYGSMKWLEQRKTYQVVLVIGLVFMMMLLAGFLPFGLVADVSAFGRFPAHVTIGGVPVRDLTRAEALARCRKQLASLAARPLTMAVDGESYSNTASEMGLELDVEKMVDQGYRLAWSPNIVERMIRRFLRKPKTLSVPLLVRYDEQKVRSFVRGAMTVLNCKPRNSYVDVTNGTAVIVPPRDGREARFDQVLAATRKGLDEGKRTVDVPIAKRTPPKVQQVNVGKLILVNLEAHTLSLYNRKTLIAKYPVATGSKAWPTCVGQWAIVNREKNPTWYNRGSTWAENMPASLPPGPNNPLGTRAMTINGGGVLIHGTTDTGSIGYSVSHGCVRMRIPDVEALFDQTYIGMPVYIIKRTGQPGFDCTKKPFWM